MLVAVVMGWELPCCVRAVREVGHGEAINLSTCQYDKREVAATRSREHPRDEYSVLREEGGGQQAAIHSTGERRSKPVTPANIRRAAMIHMNHVFPLPPIPFRYARIRRRWSRCDVSMYRAGVWNYHRCAYNLCTLATLWHFAAMHRTHNDDNGDEHDVCGVCSQSVVVHGIAIHQTHRMRHRDPDCMHAPVLHLAGAVPYCRNIVDGYSSRLVLVLGSIGCCLSALAPVL